MDRFKQDFILSLRRLRRDPGFTAAAIVTLALGIGANTTVFTAVNTLLFRPLPVERPSELTFLNHRLHTGDVPYLSYPDYRDYRDRNQVFSGLFAYMFAPASLSQGGGQNKMMWGYLVTGNYFDVLGVRPLLGRFLHAEDDVKRGGHPVAVISYGCWQSRFGGDPAVVGRSVKLNGLDYTIQGIAPAGFFGTERIFTAEFWVPMSQLSQIQPGVDWFDDRASTNIMMIGRLKPGITQAQAEAELNIVAAQLGREFAKEDEGMKIALSPPGLVGSYFRKPMVGASTVLMIVAGMVLLIACVNLASLLLARAAERRKETAVRLALGASRGRLIRQLLTESLLLSAAGGAAGLLLALWLRDLFAAWRPPVDIPLFPPLSLDYRVMLFSLVVSTFAGVLFGLAPALQSTKVALIPALKNAQLTERLRRWPARDMLVAVQVALSVVLLVGSVLVMRSLQHALSLNIGFEPRHAASVSMELGLDGYNEARGREFQRRLLENVRSTPGVESAGLINGLPLTLSIHEDGVYIQGKAVPHAADTHLAAMYRVSPEYFTTAHTRLVAGRAIDDRDKAGAKLVAVVNEALVHQLLPDEDPIGKRFRHGFTDDMVEIVGVVEDGKYRSLGEAPKPAVFLPFLQSWTSETTLVARSSLPEGELVGLLKRSVQELDPIVTIHDADSLTGRLGLALFSARITAIILGSFGTLALLLAATGVYGIMAYAVSRRSREIGIRMALGASGHHVARVVLGRATVLLAAGATCGALLALAAGKLFAPILYGVSSRDPITYAVVIGIMALVTLLSCWLPARRAVTVDPSIVLRSE